jgi:hypothetical protein
MAVEADAHQVEGLALVPVGRRPHADEARDVLAVVDPDLQANARSTHTKAEQVVADRKSQRLRLRQTLVALRRGLVQVAAAGCADVTGDALCAPAEVVRGGDVREEVEAQLVTQVQRGLDQTWRVDDNGRLAVLLLNLDEPGYTVVVQDATPRISYAGGTPAMTFSCSRTMPSISASGRGGHPGTCTSTATILSTPWSVV